MQGIVGHQAAPDACTVSIAAAHLPGAAPGAVSGMHDLCWRVAHERLEFALTV